MIKQTLKAIACITCAGIIVAATSCGSVMLTTPHSMAPSSGNALVTVLNPFVPFASAVEIFDGEKSQGVCPVRACLQFEVTPGTHVLMAKRENWDVITAELEAGKRYYAYVRSHPGVWRSRVIFDPISKSEDPHKTAKRAETMRTYSLDPAKEAAYQAKRKRLTTRALKNYKAGKVKSKTMKKEDGI